MIMRSLIFLLVTTVPAGAAPAAEPKEAGGTFVYVSVAAEKRIAVYRMDRTTGKLTHRGDAKLDGELGGREPRQGGGAGRHLPGV